MALATFGGGCFWCTEALFQQLKGISQVTSGYTGGTLLNPTYPDICKGTSGHAEAIQIQFDPKIISYEELIKIHLSTHNPTTINQQGADRGPQYRSAIFPHNDKQHASAKIIITVMQAENDNKIITSIETYNSFYPAEKEHQNYYNNHSEARYCQIVIAPKLRRLKKLFTQKMKQP